MTYYNFWNGYYTMSAHGWVIKASHTGDIHYQENVQSQGQEISRELFLNVLNLGLKRLENTFNYPHFKLIRVGKKTRMLAIKGSVGILSEFQYSEHTIMPIYFSSTRAFDGFDQFSEFFSEPYYSLTKHHLSWLRWLTGQ